MWGISCFKEWFHPAIANERIFGTGWKHTYSAGTSVAPRLCVKASNVNLPLVEPSYFKTIVIWKPSWAWIGMMKELSNVHPEWPCPPKGSSCPASDAKVSLKARRPLLVFSITNGRDQKMTYIIQDVEYLSSSYRGSVWTHRLQVESGFNRRFLDSTLWEQLDNQTYRSATKDIASSTLSTSMRGRTGPNISLRYDQPMSDGSGIMSIRLTPALMNRPQKRHWR